MKNRNGLTILELLSVISIGMLILTFSSSAIGSFMARIELSGAVSTITSCLSEARYISLSQFRKIKVIAADNSASLYSKRGSGWVLIKSYSIKGKVNINSNSDPVFSPKGTASPLCSIYISNKMYGYVVTLSFAGRIKIRKILY